MAHLIRPVRMGPVLNEKDLPDERLSEDEERELLRLLRKPDLTEAHRKALQDLEQTGKMAHDLADSLQELEQTVEDYEESLVPEGHHPVHHESIRGS